MQTPLPVLLRSHPIRERSGVSFDYEPTGDGLIVRISQKGRTITALLEWAFGSGAQAWTPVGRIDDVFFEHRVSYYTAASGARLTLGHPGAPSKNPRSALGMRQDPAAIERCFGCHGTGVQPGPDLRIMIPGVTCERCHGPGAVHAAGGAQIMRVKSNDRSAVLALCGECHRRPDKATPEPEKDDPLSIRFAPVGLVASKCYKQSRNLTCLTCHDPHGNAVRDESFYSSRCAGCHAGSSLSCSSVHGDNCIGCHMRQSSPAPYLTFTDHRIRVYRDSGKQR